MRVAQHLKTAATSAVGLQMMMTPRTVALAVARFDVIDLAVATRSNAANTNAVIFGAALCPRSSKTPDVFALPSATTCVGAPGGAPLTSNYFIAPMTATNLAVPFAERACDALGNKRWQLEFVN